MPNADEDALRAMRLQALSEHLASLREGEMLKADEDALRAIRAASTALQKLWPEGESPRLWQGVKWSGDRVQELNFHGSVLEVLPPQIGQLTALTQLELCGCRQLKELPPEFGQLLALDYIDFEGCEQLTLAPGAKDEQRAQTIVAAYAPLLIVAPHKDAPGELLPFLRANPLAVAPFFGTILTDAAHATWLGEAVKATPELAKLTDADGRRAIDVAHSACKRAMQAALFLLGRFDVDDGKLLHRSATAAVAAANDHGDPEAKPVPRVALKAMRQVDQVRAELEGRFGLDPEYVIAIKAVYADKEAVNADAWGTLERAAAGLQGVELQRVPGLSRSIRAHLFPSKQEMDRAPADDASSEYKLLIVLELADRNLKHTIDHEHIAGGDWHAIRYVASHLGRALDHVHAKGGIHADLKPLNAVSDGITWKLIDFDVFCKVGEPFGNKIPSSGYCPPEMARVLLSARISATDQDTGEVDTSRLKEYLASEAYDLWSFGVVLYHLCFGRPLWLTDINDNVDLDGLQLIASASNPRLRKALDKALNNGVKRSASDELKVATALLRKLLEPDPSKRLEHFEKFDRPMEGVLEETFFRGENLDAATLKGIAESQEEMKQVLANQSRSEITGIPTKAAYDLLLKKLPEGRLRCVYSIDMANLKVLNEWPGLSHDKADAVLKWYAEQLEKEASQIKELDLVQDAGAYHMHGDEFCVVVCAAQDVDEAAFTKRAEEMLHKMAAIQYQQQGYPETYLRIGALCAPDADYEKADILQDAVGKQLKLLYPDRSKVCPLAGRRNYSFESVGFDGKRLAEEALNNPPSGASGTEEAPRGAAEAARWEAEGTPFDCWLQLLEALKKLCITQDPEQSA